MKILAVETSSEICGVALIEDEILIKEEILEDKNTHSVKLMPLVDKLLKETNTNLDEIDLFAVDNGPGSFTGIRIGIATIKAFMDATNKKGIGVTSLECLAYNVSNDGIICSIIDAKNDNVYYGIFEKIGDIIKNEEKDFSNINALVEYLKKIKKEIIFIGSGAIAYKEIIIKELQEAKFVEDINLNKLNARNIAFAALNNKEKIGDSNFIIPTYLRKSNAER